MFVMLKTGFNPLQVDGFQDEKSICLRDFHLKLMEFKQRKVHAYGVSTSVGEEKYILGLMLCY